MLIGGLCHASINFVICGVGIGSSIDGSQTAVWPLALEDEFRSNNTLKVKCVFKILITSYIEKIRLKRRFKFDKISFVTYNVRQFVPYCWSCHFKGAIRDE